MIRKLTHFLYIGLLSCPFVAIANPALPVGLIATEKSAPALPSGLFITQVKPSQENYQEVHERNESELDIEHRAFIEYRYGQRINNKSKLHSDEYINEARLQVSTDIEYKDFKLETTFDILADSLAEDRSIDLESGQGWLDIRKFSLYWDINENIDLKVGRQTFTWGTGDFLFLNDLFPKDWNYFLGRDMEYVKAPSDALKVTLYSDVVNLDFIYAPKFDSSHNMTGKRMSIYDTSISGLVGKNNPIKLSQSSQAFKDDEFHVRLFKNYFNTEFAIYGYKGFYNSPAAYDPATNRYLFPELWTMGFSLRRPFGPGLINIEFADWNSADDLDGTNPLINNGEYRYTVGYEFEAAKEFTVGVQYYNERMKDYSAYKASLSPSAIQLRENRELITLRLKKLMMSQKLKLSLFSYFEQANNDMYIRPELNYKIDDSWSTEIGGTLFHNDNGEEYATFGQLEENSNVYMMLRYSF